MKKTKPKSKAKYKGVRYIAKALNKYQKSKYPTYKQALPEARSIYSSIKTSGQKIKLSAIWDLSRVKRGPRSTKSKGEPILPIQLTEPSYYFELIDYPMWILRCSNDVFFISDLWPSNLPDVQGGSKILFETYFNDYVNYVNGLKLLTSPTDNRYETDWLVTATKPYKNKALKRWESKIYSIDGNGNAFNYGFNPEDPTQKPASLLTSPTAPAVKSKIQTSVQDLERVKDIKGLIAELRQDVKDGLISKSDYSKKVDKLISKLEKGGSI